MMKFPHIALPPPATSAALRRHRSTLRARVKTLRSEPDGKFVCEFPGLVAEVEASFRHEESMLERLGDACLHPRRADHAVILCALHRSAPRVESGDVALGRQLADALEHVLAWQD